MIPAEILKEFVRVVGGEHVLTAPEDLAAYSYDGTLFEHRPDAVVSPANTQEVSRVVEICCRAGIPVVARGMGSGLAGGAVPLQGGVVLCLTRMNQIVSLDVENMQVLVEAGMITAVLQAQVEAQGLFYPPDPSSNRHSTIGGNVACNAGGPRCLKYGLTRDYVMALTVVLADGRILHVGGKPIKNVTAYDLKDLFIGSEGTLGIVTEVLLKLTPKPQFARTATAVYARLEDASETVNKILRSGLLPATIELMDNTTIGTVEDYMHLGLPTDADALLLIEVDGSDGDKVTQDIDTIARICRDMGAREVRVAQSEAERAELWLARRSVYGSLTRRGPDQLSEDISVPRSAIPEAVRRIKAIGQKYGLRIAVFGHAGDGNLHPSILFDRRDSDQAQRTEEASKELFVVAVELEGTLSGEHGVGVQKLPFLEMAESPLEIQLMQSIKHVLDPKNILNPGKKLPAKLPEAAAQLLPT